MTTLQRTATLSCVICWSVAAFVLCRTRSTQIPLRMAGTAIAVAGVPLLLVVPDAYLLVAHAASMLSAMGLLVLGGGYEDGRFSVQRCLEQLWVSTLLVVTFWIPYLVLTAGDS